MGRAPCCDKANVKRGPWSPEEDSKLKDYIERYGTGGNWIALPQKAGLRRCGKSCRLRWLNYLRPNIKHGGFSDEEDRIIFNLFISIGSRWSIIAAQLPGRTDNDIKNYWNTKLKKKLMGLFPNSHRKLLPPPPLPLPQPCVTTTPAPPPLVFPSSIGQPQRLSIYSPSLSKDDCHSYIDNYPFASDNSTTTTTTTTSLFATVNPVFNSCYKPFSIKDQHFFYFGSDSRSCNSNENEQMMMGMMIKNEEEVEVVHHDGFEFGRGINQWGEKMYNESCFGSDFDLIDHNHSHHGVNKLGVAQEKGLYYL